MLVPRYRVRLYALNPYYERLPCRSTRYGVCDHGRAVGRVDLNGKPPRAHQRLPHEPLNRSLLQGPSFEGTAGLSRPAEALAVAGLRAYSRTSCARQALAPMAPQRMRGYAVAASTHASHSQLLVRRPAHVASAAKTQDSYATRLLPGSGAAVLRAQGEAWEFIHRASCARRRRRTRSASLPTELPETVSAERLSD